MILELGGLSIPLKREKRIPSSLNRTYIIGHRGLGFGDLPNTKKALSHAWLFGSTGLEFDVSIPAASRSGPTDGFFGPRIEHAAVYHPPKGQETELQENISKRYSKASVVIEDIEDFAFDMVYIDVKSKWLSPESTREALAHLSAMIPLRYRHSMVLAATHDDAVVAMGERRSDLAWALEATEVEDKSLVACSWNNPPTLLSLNVSKADDWLAEADRMEWGRPLSAGLVLWTINSQEDLRLALRMADSAVRSRILDPSVHLGLMTDHPHRLAHWLMEL